MLADQLLARSQARIEAETEVEDLNAAYDDMEHNFNVLHARSEKAKICTKEVRSSHILAVTHPCRASLTAQHLLPAHAETVHEYWGSTVSVRLWLSLFTAFNSDYHLGSVRAASHLSMYAPLRHFKTSNAGCSVLVSCLAVLT